MVEAAKATERLEKGLHGLAEGVKVAEEIAVTEQGKELFKFTGTAAQHMNEKHRRIPIQLLEEIIKSPIAVVSDPKSATNALMYYSTIWRNKKLYNVEVLYDKASNTILHFQYTRDPLGPLKAILK